MDKLIYQIRTHLNMNQTEFAQKLNVTFATVNRWENGRALPTKLAQTMMFELCKELQVPVYDMIISNITKAAKELNIDANRVVLYHGSKSGIDGKIEPKSREFCDFGKGFYMGTEPEQALTLICDFDKSKFYIISINTDKLKKLEVPADIDWAMLVAYHRGKMNNIIGTPMYNKYHNMASGNDLMVGCIANDRMFYVIDNFFVGNITDIALVNSLSALKLGKQYVAVTQKACDAIRIEKEITLSYFERMFIKEVAEANREKGVSFANDICKKHRREGLFFDEIIGGSNGGI